MRKNTLPLMHINKQSLKTKKMERQIQDNRSAYLVFLILTFVLYINTLNNSFAFDDGFAITENRFVQQGIKGIPDIIKNDSFLGAWLTLYGDQNVEQFNNGMKMMVGGRYRPLSLVTFALEVELFGKENMIPNTNSEGRFKGNAFVSHLINLLLYLFTACLLFLVMGRLFPNNNDKKWYFSFPFITTLLFLCHPIHTEVVANIKGRDEIMALLGALGTLWFTIKYIDARRYSNLVLSGLCLLGGLLSKENVITFLAVIPLSIYYFRRINLSRLLISFLPLLLVALIFLLIRAFVAGWIDTAALYPELMNNPFLLATKSETWATIFYALIWYVKLLFFPHPLTYDYYPHHIETVNWPNPVAIFSLLFYLGIVAYAVYGLFKKRDIFSYSIWLYLIPLSLVSNFFFPMSPIIGERWIYMSSIGFVLIIGHLINVYLPKLFKKTKKATIISGVFLAIVLSLYSVKTITRNRVWKDNFTLFTTDVQTSRNSAKGNYEAGFHYLAKAVSPDNKDEALRRNENCEQAAQFLLRTIQLYPQYLMAYENLCILYYDCYRDVAKSIQYFTMSQQLQRSNFITNFPIQMLNEIPSLLEKNQISSSTEALLQSLNELLHVRPDIGEAWYVTGVIYGSLNNIEGALVHLEHALSMDFPKTSKFYEYLGTAYGIAGDNPKALRYLLKAVELGASDLIIYHNIGTIYQSLGDRDKADLYLKKAQECNTSNL